MRLRSDECVAGGDVCGATKMSQWPFSEHAGNTSMTNDPFGGVIQAQEPLVSKVAWNLLMLNQPGEFSAGFNCN